MGTLPNGVLTEAKYLSRNPISRHLLSRFFNKLLDCVCAVPFDSVLEAGCGEGVVLQQLRGCMQPLLAVAFDIDPTRLAAAASSCEEVGLMRASIYQIPLGDAEVDMVICSEVLEHLEDPAAALAEIRRVSRRYAVLSVPNEPLWRILNMTRGAYWGAWGNTPGHVNHWSSGAFRALVERYFHILRVERPLPWTVLLAEKT